MNDVIKGVILMAMIVYIVSPIDLAFGPIDDLIVLAIGLASNKALSAYSSRNSEPDEQDEDYSVFY